MIVFRVIAFTDKRTLLLESDLKENIIGSLYSVYNFFLILTSDLKKRFKY